MSRATQVPRKHSTLLKACRERTWLDISWEEQRLTDVRRQSGQAQPGGHL